MTVKRSENLFPAYEKPPPPGVQIDPLPDAILSSRTPLGEHRVRGCEKLDTTGLEGTPDTTPYAADAVPPLLSFDPSSLKNTTSRPLERFPLPLSGTPHGFSHLIANEIRERSRRS